MTNTTRFRASFITSDDPMGLLAGHCSVPARPAGRAPEYIERPVVELPGSGASARLPGRWWRLSEDLEHRFASYTNET